MNSDGPTLPIEYLRQAFELLIDPGDVVLGPSDDGGYYLIGLRKPAPRLLREVRMSTSQRIGRHAAPRAGRKPARGFAAAVV